MQTSPGAKTLTIVSPIRGGPGSRRSLDKWIKVWDFNTGKCIDAWAESSDVLCVAWAPVHGCYLAAATQGGRIKLYPAPASNMALNIIEEWDKDGVQDRMAVLLCQWMHLTLSNPDIPIPCLEIKGQKTTAFKECLILPDLRAGLTSAIAAITVRFPSFTAVPLQRTLYIVFKGTTQIHDWLANVSIHFNRTAYADHGVAPHAVFHQELENRKEFHTHDLKLLLERLVCEDSDLDLVITGTHPLH